MGRLNCCNNETKRDNCRVSLLDGSTILYTRQATKLPIYMNQWFSILSNPAPMDGAAVTSPSSSVGFLEFVVYNTRGQGGDRQAHGQWLYTGF